MTHPERPDRSPAVAELLDDAYVAPVGVETAARHLWAIHAEANRVAAAQATAAEPASPASRRIPRAAVPVLALVMAMSSSGMALAASQSSLPGDVLYPVKRGTEQAQLIFARNPEARTQLQLSFARTRLEEIRQIAATRPQHVPALVAAINVTLSAAQLDAPEDSERVRREIDAEIASLDLPATTTEAATTSTSTSTGTVLQGTATPTEAPTAGATTATTAATPATADPSAEPTPTGSAAEPVPTSADGSEGEVATDEPTATDGTAVPTDAEPTGGPTPTTSPSPTPTTSPSDGPIVTARPHPGAVPDGTSRTEEPDPAPTADPTEGEPTEEPSGGHFSRPGS